MPPSLQLAVFVYIHIYVYVYIYVQAHSGTDMYIYTPQLHMCMHIYTRQLHLYLNPKHPTRYSLPITLHATAYLSPYTLQPTYQALHPTPNTLFMHSPSLVYSLLLCTARYSLNPKHPTPYSPSTLHATAYLLSPASYTYGVPTFGTLLKIIRLFCRISSLLQNIVSVLRLFCKRAL